MGGSRSRSDFEAAHAAVAAMLAPVGAAYREEDRAILLAYGTDLQGADEADLDRLEELYGVCFRGFFHCAAEGRAFVPVGGEGDDFGRSIDANYPGAGGGFRRLAVSYWSLKMLEGRLAERHSGIVLQQLLLGIVTRVQQAFFADPGTGADESGERAALQRRLIEESGAPIDVDAFILGNPLLVGNPLA